MMEPYNDEKQQEDPEIARRRAIQQVYFDNTLTPAEKHRRILVIQGAQDSDSDNMSIFTEGTGVKSPKHGSVSSKNSSNHHHHQHQHHHHHANRGRSRHHHEDTKTSTTNNSIKSHKSHKSHKTSTSKKSSKSHSTTNATRKPKEKRESTSKKESKPTDKKEQVSKQNKKETTTTTTRTTTDKKNNNKKEESKSSTTTSAVAIIEPAPSQKTTSPSSSLSVYDARGNNEQPHDDDLYIAPPMEDVESVIPNMMDDDNEDDDEGMMKDIPLDDDDEPVPLLQNHNTAMQSSSLVKPKTKSDGGTTKGSETAPAYDSASMNSSIDTHEQNDEIMMKKVHFGDGKQDQGSTPVKDVSYRKKRACGFCFCSLLLCFVLMSPLVYFHRDWFAKTLKPLSSSKANEEGLDMNSNDAPTMPVETAMPSSSPTKEYLYDPPSAQDCQDIANRKLPLKDGWILRRFQVPMDVNLKYETTDVDTMTQMLVSHLQSDLAPVLAGCTHVVGETFLRGRRLDTTRFVIGNAILSAWHESDDVCATQTRTCYRVMVEMSLYVQGTKSNTSLQNLVTDALEQAGADGESSSSLVNQLDLPSPFDDIKVRGVYPTFTTNSPTTTPSDSPTKPITASPTTAPVVPATSNPTIAGSAPPTVQPTPGPTNSPTPLPTEEAPDCKSTLQQVLEKNGVTQLNNNAFQWMKVDQWRCNGDESSIVDRYALASIYLTLGGDQWLRKTQWMSASSVCEWQGVGCDVHKIAVTSLHLGGNQLAGAMPAELTLLTKLNSLDLDTNGLGSSILPELANLVELTNLNLANNALTGQVPDTFSSLVNLESFKVDSNQMQGGLTTQIGQMTNLLELSLSANNLSGNIPTEIGMLSVLQNLNLSTNQFSSIPAEISQLTSLRSLEISSNKVKGDIPELQGMVQLTLLRLDNNKLSGNIPQMPSSLTTCNLTKNKFKGNNKNKNGVCILN
mmetsp:Transcript_21289/g.52456  ORF Transcript_21289/g.52456 Transcript_21289/m.52456 type:complete len:958 (-) Transcript_21289:151-3024(-)